MRPRYHLRVAVAVLALGLALSSCSTRSSQEAGMSHGPSDSAERVWDATNERVETTQALVEGPWLAYDTAARGCGSTGAQWLVSRIGPGSDPGSRTRLLAAVEERWSGFGWSAVRSTIGGDAPGDRLRYPSAGSTNEGFFVELTTNAHATTITVQTPCATGDVAALNAEAYAERHTTTPPDVPGATDGEEP